MALMSVFAKADFLIVSNLDSSPLNSTFDRFLQSRKVLGSIVITKAGILTDVRPVPLKAAIPIVSNLESLLNSSFARLSQL